MNFEFFKQKYDGKISAGDEIALFSDHFNDGVLSGRYKVAGLGADADGQIFATLVGMNHCEGTVCEVPLDAHEGDRDDAD